MPKGNQRAGSKHNVKTIDFFDKIGSERSFAAQCMNNRVAGLSRPLFGPAQIALSAQSGRSCICGMAHCEAVFLPFDQCAVNRTNAPKGRHSSCWKSIFWQLTPHKSSDVRPAFSRAENTNSFSSGMMIRPSRKRPTEKPDVSERIFSANARAWPGFPAIAWAAAK